MLTTQVFALRFDHRSNRVNNLQHELESSFYFNTKANITLFVTGQKPNRMHHCENCFQMQVCETNRNNYSIYQKGYFATAFYLHFEPIINFCLLNIYRTNFFQNASMCTGQPFSQMHLRIVAFNSYIDDKSK